MVALCVGTFFWSQRLSLFNNMRLCYLLVLVFVGVAVGTLGKLRTCYICQSVAISLMLCMVANFFWNALCHSYWSQV